MKNKWAYDDEKIVCKFYLKNKKDYRNIDELMGLLNNKFPKSSVKMKLKNFEYLDTGEKGLPNYSFLSNYVYRQMTNKGNKKGLSKAAKGFQPADVANAAVRNILTMLSVYFGDVTAQDIIETSEMFNYCCPYSGRNLKEEIENKMQGKEAPNIELDHIIPQNRVYCGLNVKGNLAWVDKKTNNRKKDKPFEKFIREDKNLNLTNEEREEKIQKILEVQKRFNYYPKEFAEIVSPIVEKRYKEIEKDQIELAKEIASKFKK